MARIIVSAIFLGVLIYAAMSLEIVRQGMLFALVVLGVWFMYRLQEFSSGHKDFVRKAFSERED